jgi:virulence-associated protein VapD
MKRHEKLLIQILRGTSDANISFADLRQLLIRLGFEERTRGSHHLFRKEGVEEKINLQREGNKAKPYQVRQVRNVIVKYGMAEGEDE